MINIDYSGPVLIMLVNTLIIYDLIRCVIRYKKMDRSNVLTKFLYKISWYLLWANTAAWLVGFLNYFFFKLRVLDLVIYGTFIDRYFMYFAYRALIRFSRDVQALITKWSGTSLKQL